MVSVVSAVHSRSQATWTITVTTEPWTIGSWVPAAAPSSASDDGCARQATYPSDVQN